MAETLNKTELPAPGSRILAYFIDCAVVLAYLGLLTAVTRIVEALGGPSLFSNRSAIALQGTVLVALVLPAALYFAWCEASARQATLGKRLCRLRVVTTAGGRATFRRTAIRTLVKLVLPWELGHSVLYYNEGVRNMSPGQPLQLTDPSVVQWIVIGAVWALVIWYAAALFVGSRRTPYDVLSGTMVVPFHADRSR